MTKKLLKVLLVIVAVALVMGAGIIYFLPTKTSNEEIIFSSDKIVTLKEISLDGNFDVNITTSDSKDIKCSLAKVKRGYVSNDYELESKIENKILHINTNNHKESVFVLGGETLSLNIDIPKTYKNKLSVKSKLTSINILNSNSEDIECITTDGKINISLDKICGNVTVNTHLGDVNFKLPKDEKFNLSAISRIGKVINDLDFNVDSSIKNKNIKVTASDGTISIKGI